ncbi:MAG: hemerythrin domain-containing protein [Deltaproteobacteria bacterium]|nr:hemerythrin domain-containing protein [Deltaproteobacteria bacterium]
MSITNELVAHHTTLRQLYAQSENDPKAFDEFTRHLIVHHTMEEKYFYDILKTIPGAEHDALEAVNEHHIIELIIKDAEGFPREHGHFPVKIEGLGEYTTHHLDEEEMDIFPMSQQVISAGDLDTLGKLFVEAKDKLLGIELPEVPGELATRAAKPSARPQPLSAGSGTSTAHGLGIGSLKS